MLSLRAGTSPTRWSSSLRPRREAPCRDRRADLAGPGAADDRLHPAAPLARAALARPLDRRGRPCRGRDGRELPPILPRPVLSRHPLALAVDERGGDGADPLLLLPPRALPLPYALALARRS